MIHKGGTPITSLDIWRQLAGPKSSVQWRDYRSAKESAYAWLGSGTSPGIPAEFTDVLATHEDFGPLGDWTAEPERPVPFDDFSGPANIDVLVTCRDDRGTFVIAVEAKADEPFGPPVDRALGDALERQLANPRSKGVTRIQDLAQALFGAATKGQPRLGQLRYQLLTASAAALAYAEHIKANRAVVMVHEFETSQTRQENRDRNAKDLIRFLARLGAPDAERVLRGELLGPIQTPGGGHFPAPVPLYLGKATRKVAHRGAVVGPG